MESPARPDISIFAKSATYRSTVKLPHPHLVRGSSIIRGDQMAEYLGCKYNPVSGYEDDVCIYVKPSNLDHIKAGAWIDVMDGEGLLSMLVARPDLNVIAFSQLTYSRFRKWIPNTMTLIPQHHCNFNREVRDRRDVKTVGFIGGEIGFAASFDEVRRMVEPLGMEFRALCRYQTREDVVDFYRKIDVQITWARPEFRFQARAPLKLTNAASFGIPTVAYPQHCYGEAEGFYAKTWSFGDMAAELARLRNDPGYYAYWSDAGLVWAERYHISNIAKLYRGLT